MNEFLRTIHCSIFKKWVTYQLENYHLEENDDVISFHSKNANGHIGFYASWFINAYFFLGYEE
ncbi:hypothetical protein SAMN05216514_11064 [Kandleria vitulina]|jgi:hypothetical protein|uniref:hypothetical protein n=1 Tax=Kandleria vitulina TaxID=1630 RepID=UPI0008C2446C|nr:hypothetical protein [Kandleria vitulina]SEJ09883.1 hypothetical protein SAMN05216514_11064 [Kandleria vitulina]